MELYRKGDLNEAHIQKIWFPTTTDGSGVVRTSCSLDYDLQEQLLLEACYKSHTQLISLLLTPTLLDYCGFETIEEISTVARDRHLLGVIRFYVEYAICDLDEILYWICKQPVLDHDTELRYIFDWLILNDSVDKAFESNLCIGAAAKYGNLYAVRALLECEEVDPSDYHNYALCMAAKHGHLEVVERLLQDGRVTPSDDDNRAIRLACKCNRIDVVQMLMGSRQVDPSCISNVCMKYAVEHAIETGHPDLVVALLADGRVSMSHAQITSLLTQRNAPCSP